MTNRRKSRWAAALLAALVRRPEALFAGLPEAKNAALIDGTPGGTAEEVELQVTAASSLPTPPQIAALYKFPRPAGTSKGQVIALMQ